VEGDHKVLLGSADAPERCSSRARVHIDTLPLQRPKTVTSAKKARIGAPHLKVLRP